jgi:hypothetical protein
MFANALLSPSHLASSRQRCGPISTGIGNLSDGWLLKTEIDPIKIALKAVSHFQQ